ncbi:rust resistance kinase Lr10-like [Neltuma alba]|uniref:rust resistance kinase Lr10-like n=1 Tax=Neltuma alba TaxID=207710 RepID=UPI0010A55738|nr:rust resistance kinase Lr10-like [Prosopis alba]
MTKNFKHKLGEGGYGSVYKGKLRSKRDVAVKLLGKSTTDGHDFINEVSTIGTIRHTLDWQKLYPTDKSIVSLTTARGTMGYMAPELLYKNIGGISHKADVYSFGMMLMEMAGRRKNHDVVQNSWQTYFAKWVHDQFEETIFKSNATEEEKKIALKMITVTFTCIQLSPSDRPSMGRVVEMLQGDVDGSEVFRA